VPLGGYLKDDAVLAHFGSKDGIVCISLYLPVISTGNDWGFFAYLLLVYELLPLQRLYI
jgi:hypothetical protein